MEIKYDFEAIRKTGDNCGALHSNIVFDPENLTVLQRHNSGNVFQSISSVAIDSGDIASQCKSLLKTTNQFMRRMAQYMEDADENASDAIEVKQK